MAKRNFMEPQEQQPEIGQELENMPYEPLLPIEKKLIVWSLGTGVLLLIILVVLGRYVFPAGG